MNPATDTAQTKLSQTFSSPSIKQCAENESSVANENPEVVEKPQISEAALIMSRRLDDLECGGTLAVRLLVGWLGLLLIAAGVFLCPVGSVKGIQNAYAFYNRATSHTQGTVIDEHQTTTHSYNGGSTTVCTTTILFRTRQGEAITFLNADCADKNQKVQVLYNPFNPQDVKTDTQAGEDVFFNIAIMICWIVLAGTGLVKLLEQIEL